MRKRTSAIFCRRKFSANMEKIQSGAQREQFMALLVTTPSLGAPAWRANGEKRKIRQVVGDDELLQLLQ